MAKNTLLIIAFLIIFIVSYTRADCKATFSVTKEDNDKSVMDGYLNSRNSIYDRFKNIMKGRLVDPICTAKEEVLSALCECITKKKPDNTKKSNKGKDGKEESKSTCTWTVLSKPNGTSLYKYANLYSCGDVYITQGYGAYDGNLHDVYVVEVTKTGEASSFIIKEVANGIDFNVFKEENHSFWNQLYLQGMSWLFNLDKHLF